MRPLELRLRDFRSYFGPEAVFDFRGRSLVGIVGPIGSGKSSILDGVSFALYGRTPAIGRATRSLIHQRADGCAVLLRFEVEGRVWEVARSLRRRGQADHALYQLTDDAPEAEIAHRLTSEAEVNARIAELLGLEFDAFRRSVLLAQGRFAEFLQARPAERDGVLKGVFGHDRLDLMRELAKTKGREASLQADVHAAKAEQLESLQARIRETRSNLDDAEQRIEQLRKADPEIRALEELASEARRRSADAAKRLMEIEAATEVLPDVSRARELVARAVEAHRLRDERAAELEAAQLAAAKANQALEAAEERGDRRDLERGAALLAALEQHHKAVHRASERLRETRERLAKATEAVGEAERRLESARKDARRAQRRLQEAEERRTQSEARLHEAHLSSAASVLRSGLAKGEPCPVCEQVVTTLPVPGEPGILEEAEAEVTRATEAYEAARGYHAQALAEEAVAAEGLEVARERERGARHETEVAEAARGEVERERDGTADQIRDVLGEGDPSELLAQRRSVLTQLVSETDAARQRLTVTRAEHDEAIRAEHDAEKALNDLRLQMVDFAARLEMEVAISGTSPAELELELDRIRTGWIHTRDTLRREREESEAEARRADEARAGLLDGLDASDGLSMALGQAEALAEFLRESLQRDQAELEAGADLAAQRDVRLAEAETYRRLEVDLRDANFIRYLLDEERRRLAELGSDHLQRLTSGRYRFTDTFDIEDLTAAEAVRKADSLSGGETFLASLALALALAEMVARTGGRLEAFFLDEGFGALDPEHLDLAMDGLETLVAENPARLVVVVSHVPELRHRLEDLVVLDRDPHTGDTIVVSGAAIR